MTGEEKKPQQITEEKNSSQIQSTISYMEVIQAQCKCLWNWKY